MATNEPNKIDLYDAMRTLRAVRRLRPDPIPDDVLYRVLEAATWAPSGGNRQAWRIIVVKDAARKQRLGELYKQITLPYTKSYMDQFENVPEEERKKAERTIRASNYLSEHFGESPVLLVFCFNPEGLAVTDAKLDRLSVVGGGSIYPAVQNLLLACRAEGLGCVLTTLMCMGEPEVRELLGIPQPWGTAAVVPIGYPVLRGHGPISRRSVEELAFADAWGAPFSIGIKRFIEKNIPHARWQQSFSGYLRGSPLACHSRAGGNPVLRRGSRFLPAQE